MYDPEIVLCIDDILEQSENFLALAIFTMDPLMKHPKPSKTQMFEEGLHLDDEL